MNRRRFLSFLGLAPVAAAVPAMALPRAEKPTEIDYDALSSDISKMWVESIEKATGPQEAMADHIDHLAIDVPVYDRLNTATTSMLGGTG